MRGTGRVARRRPRVSGRASWCNGSSGSRTARGSGACVPFAVGGAGFPGRPWFSCGRGTRTGVCESVSRVDTCVSWQGQAGEKRRARPRREGAAQKGNGKTNALEGFVKPREWVRRVDGSEGPTRRTRPAGRTVAGAAPCQGGAFRLETGDVEGAVPEIDQRPGQAVQRVGLVRLAAYAQDIRGSVAHAEALAQAGIITGSDLRRSSPG